MGAGALSLVAAVVSSPAPAFQASLQGLRLWWQIVFPALLPFLVLSEMLIAYGWIHALGTWLEPLMNRLFKLPGIGGWVLAMGMTTGFPGGAQAARQLHEQGALSAEEASKLAALSHFCNPMLILIVIATGLMHDPATGYILLAVHWITGLSAFLLLGEAKSASKGGTGRDLPVKKPLKQEKGSFVYRSLQSAKRAHAMDGRSFGRLLGDSVTNAVQTLMMVGGYIIIFAVVIQIVSRIVSGFFPSYWLSGLFEIHLGAKDAAAAGFASDKMQWSVISALLGFSGISAILQSMSALKKSEHPPAPLRPHPTSPRSSRLRGDLDHMAVMLSSSRKYKPGFQQPWRSAGRCKRLVQLMAGRTAAAALARSGTGRHARLLPAAYAAADSAQAFTLTFIFQTNRFFHFGRDQIFYIPLISGNFLDDTRT